MAVTGKWRLLVYGAASLGQSILLCAPASAINTSQHGYSSALAIAGAGEDAADIRKFGGVIQKWSGGLSTLNPDKLRCTPAEEMAHTNDQRGDFRTAADNGGPVKTIHDTIFPRYAKKSAGIEHGAGLMAKSSSDLNRPASASAANADEASGTAPNDRAQTSEPWNPTHKSHKDIRAALAAAGAATDEQSALNLHKELPGYPVESEADLQAVYERMKNVRARRGTARDAESANEQMMYLSFVIAKSTAPKYHKWIAKLLEREYDELPSKYAGVWGALTRADAAKDKIRFGPAVALMTACGDGKIRAALPILRKIRDKEGMVGHLADFAIARIADPEDLRITIEMLKRDPTARPPLGLYGDAVVPALLAEVEDGALSPEIRQELALRIQQGARIGNCHLFEPLLTHRDPDVVRAAVKALLKCPTSEDAPLVLRLLANPNEEVRQAGLNALDYTVWNRELALKTIQILLNDKSNITRWSAAMVLEKRREPLAREAFERASNDPYPPVRRIARDALNALDSGRSE